GPRGVPGLVRQPDEPLAPVQHRPRPLRRDARARAHDRRSDRRLAGHGTRGGRAPSIRDRLQLLRRPLHVRQPLVRASEPLAVAVEYRSHAEVSEQNGDELMKLALNQGLSGAATLSDDIDRVLEAERLGYDSVWTSESYGSDAVTTAKWIQGRTPRKHSGPAIMREGGRTP